MPKINSAGVPSYDGQQGTVTNAVGEQFDLAPEPSDGDVNEPVGEFEESPAPGIPGDVRPLVDDGDAADRNDKDSDDDESDRTPGDSWDPAGPEPDNQTPAFDTPKKSTSKAAAPKK